MEGWVGLVGWPIADSLHTKWSAISATEMTDIVSDEGVKLYALSGQVSVRSSPPVKDRCPNHWAMPPALYFSYFS